MARLTVLEFVHSGRFEKSVKKQNRKIAYDENRVTNNIEKCSGGINPQELCAKNRWNV